METVSAGAENLTTQPGGRSAAPRWSAAAPLSSPPGAPLPRHQKLRVLCWDRSGLGSNRRPAPRRSRAAPPRATASWAEGGEHFVNTLEDMVETELILWDGPELPLRLWRINRVLNDSALFHSPPAATAACHKQDPVSLGWAPQLR